MQRDCLTFHERQKLFIFFFPRRFQKVLNPSAILLFYFLTANIIFICYFFSLIIMALPACTCEPGLRSVSLAQKISARCNTGSYVFSFFFICIFIIFFALLHICFLFPQRVPPDLEGGYEKSILTRTETLFYHYLFQNPVNYNFISQDNMFLFAIYFHQNMKLGPDKFFCFVTTKNCVCDDTN